MTALGRGGGFSGSPLLPVVVQICLMLGSGNVISSNHSHK